MRATNFFTKKLCVRQDQVLCQPPYKTSSYLRDNTSSTLGNHDGSQRSPPSLDIYMCAETSNILPLFVHIQRQPNEPSYHPTSLADADEGTDILSELHHSPMFTDMIDWTMLHALCNFLMPSVVKNFISQSLLHFSTPTKTQRKPQTFTTPEKTGCATNSRNTIGTSPDTMNSRSIVTEKTPHRPT